MVRGKTLTQNWMTFCLGAIAFPLSAVAPSLASETPSTTVAPIPPALTTGLMGMAEPELPPLGEVSKYLPGSLTRLVLDLSDRRLYVYVGEQAVANYPVAIGKPGWETNPGSYEVINMEVDPIFKSFKTGRLINPGPDNPLGPRWIGFWTDGKTQMGFHGTNEPELIGQAVSHGCVRMLNKDVIALYEKVALGTTVTVKP